MLHCSTIPAIPLGGGQVVRDYLAAFERVEGLYAHDPLRQETYDRRAAYLRENWRGDRLTLARGLEDYNRSIGAGEKALANCRLLAREGTLCTVTGQQAGALTGPLYTVLKALGAVLFARQQAERLGTPVVPVFWLNADDHDFAEIAAVHLTTPQDGLVRLSLAGDADGRRSAGHLPVTAEAFRLVEAVEGLLPPSDFKEGVFRLLREAADASDNLADWCGRLMAHLFREQGLVVCNSILPVVRRLEASVFARALRRSGAVQGALEAAYARWAELGYEPTVNRQPDHMNLFRYVDGQRLPLMREADGRVNARGSDLRWTAEELASEAEAHPERFSPNVVLGPICRDAVFPNLAYHGGPGEISYFGLLRGVFEAMEAQMPPVVPRLSLTLLEPPMARYLDKQALSVEDVALRLAAVRQAVLDKEDQLGLNRLFGTFRSQVVKLHEALSKTVTPLDPSLPGIAKENRRQILNQVQYLEDKVRQAHRQNSEIALRQIDRLGQNLYPNGGPQDRTLNIVPFLCRYGPDLLDRLAAVLPYDGAKPWQHVLVRL